MDIEQWATIRQSHLNDFMASKKPLERQRALDNVTAVSRYINRKFEDPRPVVVSAPRKRA